MDKPFFPKHGHTSANLLYNLKCAALNSRKDTCRPSQLLCYCAALVPPVPRPLMSVRHAYIVLQLDELPWKQHLAWGWCNQHLQRQQQMFKKKAKAQISSIFPALYWAWPALSFNPADTFLPIYCQVCVFHSFTMAIRTFFCDQKQGCEWNKTSVDH